MLPKTVMNESSFKKCDTKVEEKWKIEKQKLLTELDVTQKNY